ncbi:MAG: PDZ domain-containing protein [Pseudomonadota bacterium]
MRRIHLVGILTAICFVAASAGYSQAQTSQPGWHGLTVASVTPALQRSRGLTLPFGAIVVGIESGSPALRAGIRFGDVIVSIGDSPVQNQETFSKAISALSPGQVAKLARYRGSEAPASVDIRLARKPPGYQAERGLFGLEVRDVTAAEASRQGLNSQRGVLVTRLRRQGSAERGGLRVGDLIVAIDGLPVRGRGMFVVEVVKRPPQLRTTLNVLRNGASRSLTLTLAKRPTGRTAPKPTGVDADGPRLMLDPGGHMGLVGDVIFTPDETQLISGSDDKVIRVWDITRRQTVRTIRGEIGPGNAGMIYAMALSPDGRWLVAAGPLKGATRAKRHAIRVIDFQTGAPVAILEGHRDAVLGVAFSRDGRRIVSGSFDKTAIVWQAADGQDGKPDWSRAQLYRQLKGHTREIYGVAFLPNADRVVTGAYDRSVRIWDVPLGTTVSNLIGHDREVHRVTVAPDGTIASGDRTGEIRIWSASDAQSGQPEIPARRSLLFKQPGGIGSLAFSPDSKRLLSTCGSGTCARQRQIVWNLTTGEQIVSPKLHTNIVLASAWTSDGKRIATAGGDQFEIQLWSSETGELVPDSDGKKSALKGNGRPAWSVAFSEDGRWLAWGSTPKIRSLNNRGPLEFAIRLPSRDNALGVPTRIANSPASRDSAAQPADLPTQWQRATTQYGGLTLRHARGAAPRSGFPVLEIRQNQDVTASITLNASTGYGHRSYSFTPDGTRIVTGAANGLVTLYDTRGKRLGRFVGHGGDIWAVTPSPDGRFLVSGSSDQTIRLWNINTRELVATLFHAPGTDGDIGEWVLWTPQGFYTGSPGGGRFVGWHVNKGRAKAADYVNGAQYRKNLNRRDVVERSIILVNAKSAAAELAPGIDLRKTLEARPPEIKHATPSQNAEVFGGRVRVTAYVKSSALSLQGVQITVNGAKVRADPSAVPIDHPRPPAGQTVVAYDVPLFQGWNDIALKAINSAGESTLATVRVNHSGEGLLDKRDILWVLAIGVDDYTGLGDTCGPDGKQSCDLSYASKDAHLFAKTIAREMGGQHTSTVTRILTSDGDPKNRPTRKNILDAMATIANAGPNDTVALFLAGHGETGANGKYFFLPTDIKRKAGAGPGTGENVIAWDLIQGRLTNALGRRLLFLDACQAGAAHAGRAYNARLSEDALYEKFVAFSAAGPNQVAIENADFGHGLFTMAIAEGLSGKALDSTERTVRVYGLSNYIARRLRGITRGRQSPVVHSGPGDLVLVRK